MIEWYITETNAPERRNLFSLAPGREAHIATLVAGSSKNLHRFDACLALIQAIPEIMGALEHVHMVLQELQFLENAEMKQARTKIETLFGRLPSSKV